MISDESNRENGCYHSIKKGAIGGFSGGTLNEQKPYFIRDVIQCYGAACELLKGSVSASFWSSAHPDGSPCVGGSEAVRGLD